MRTMEHKEYLDAVLRGADLTIVEAVRFNYYDDLLDILNHFADRSQATIDCNIGWFPLIAQLHRKLKYLDIDYKIFQIKQKFGGLRYYYTPSDNPHYDLPLMSSIMFDLVSIAENKSYVTCEVCSKQGSKSNKNYWIRTVCPQHDV